MWRIRETIKEREDAQFEGETKETKKNACRLYERGDSIEDIADVLQSPVSQISLWLENSWHFLKVRVSY